MTYEYLNELMFGEKQLTLSVKKLTIEQDKQMLQKLEKSKETPTVIAMKDTINNHPDFEANDRTWCEYKLKVCELMNQILSDVIKERSNS